MSLFLLGMACTAAGGNIYVDADASGANNGSSWADAFNDLQDALAAAWSGDEMWVAQGIYKPAGPPLPPPPPPPPPLASTSWSNSGSSEVTPGDRTATFQLKNGVAVKGGYAGFGEPDPDARDIDAYETILSGDLLGNDGPDFANNYENSYHVVTGSGTYETAVLDGFTIIGGNADGSYPNNDGGGMCNDSGSPTVTNCTFSGNSAGHFGGGLHNSFGSPTLTNCSFIRNWASVRGGGMCSWSATSSPTLTNCTFMGNAVGRFGGGLVDYYSNLTLTNCTFIDNSADIRAGGMEIVRYSSPTLINCTFSGNSAHAFGGGIYICAFCTPTLTNCTFAANSASVGNAFGCGSYERPSSVELTNCILWDGGKEIWNNDNSAITITCSDVQGGWPGAGNINADPLFVDLAIGDYHLLPGSPCIDAGDNSAVPPSVVTDLDGNYRIANGIVDMGAYEFGSTAPSSTSFVDAGATGANNGSGWVDAFADLQEALSVATAFPQVDEIRVAQGIYKPTGQQPPPPPPPPSPPMGSSSGQNPIATAVDREATFQLINGVAIYGGYAGVGEPDPNARDIAAYETVLSGDLLGNDGPDFANNYENSYHVVTGSGTDSTAVFDGFTITGGNANSHWWWDGHDSGGGMINDSGSPTVTNCTFTGNWASWGGGMLNFDISSPTLTNCTFSDNSAEDSGGAMANVRSRPTLTNCTFRDNSASYGGGGIYNWGSRPTLVNCTFRGNSTAQYGGGMYNKDSSATIRNCIFSGNSADYGGGIWNYKDSSLMLTNCTFSGNAALSDGGAIYNHAGHLTLTNCILWGDSPEEISREWTAFVNVNHSCIQGGWEGEGNIDADPCFVEPGSWELIEGKVSYWKFDEGGGTTAYDSAGNNDGTVYGAQWTTGQISGALSFDGVDDYVRTANNVFTNAQLASGATLSAWFKTDSTTYGYIADNEGYLTLGVNHIYAANPNKLCGIVDGGHHRFFSSSDVTDNLWHHAVIVWDGTNTAILYLDGVNVSSGFSGPPTPDRKSRPFAIGAHSTIAAYFNGLIDDVRIYDRALSGEEIQQLYQIGVAGPGDYHLLADSPCINAGDPDYVAEPNETDLDGKPRVIGGRIDMGAYEFNHIPVACIVDGNQVVEAEAPWGARVTLDGSRSSDADSTPGTNDDIVCFDWYKVDACDPNFEDFLASGEIIDCNLPLGEHIIVLEVIDKAGAFDTNEVTIIVQDTTPPVITLSVTPTMLWPANHKMVLITPSWTVSDICDDSPEVSLLSITTNEADEAKGDGHTAGDIQIGDDGSIYLRAERSGTGSGRIYTITYQAVDDSGNAAVARATVTVPHDQR